MTTPPSPLPSAERLRVLIADDVQETRRSTRLMMTLIPEVEVVAIAENGREAVEMAQIKQPDIALMDVNMPGMDGLEAIHLMIKKRPDMACIVLSAERESQTLQRAIAAGARGYLIKPFTSDQLAQTMRRVIDWVRANRARVGNSEQLRQERDLFLQELAAEYARTRRTDDKAMSIFEQLAQDPHCDLRWLRTLAVIYVIRQQWGKLKFLAERLEKQAG